VRSPHEFLPDQADIYGSFWHDGSLARGTGDASGPKSDAYRVSAMRGRLQYGRTTHAPATPVRFDGLKTVNLSGHHDKKPPWQMPGVLCYTVIRSRYGAIRMFSDFI
jgi:hypothetical protein